MQTTVSILVFVLALLGIFVFARLTLFHAPKVVEESQLVATVAETQDTNHFLREGILMRYQATDIPTYYLLYEGNNGQFLRKELRFSSERGCNAQAGDLPCVSHSSSNEPPVSIGSYVRVEGLQDAQRVIVERIGVVGNPADVYDIVSSRVGDTIELSGLSISVLSVTNQGSCKVFSGCFDDGIPRATFAYEAGVRSGEKTFVPGMFMDIPGGNLLLLWADVEEEEAVFVVARRSTN